jgi:hypothetical protein
VLDGGINLSVAFRARHLRYCDTGDVAAAVPGIRVAMLGELLGITVWQPAEADGLGVLPPGGVPPLTATGPAAPAHLAPAAPAHPAPVAEVRAVLAAEAHPAPAAEVPPALAAEARPVPTPPARPAPAPAANPAAPARPAAARER